MPSSEAPVACALKMASSTVPVRASLALSAVPAGASSAPPAVSVRAPPASPTTPARAPLAPPAVPVRAPLTVPTSPVRAPSTAVWPVALPDLCLLPCAVGGERKSAVAVNLSSAASARRSSPKPSWVRSSDAPAAPCRSRAAAAAGVSSVVGRQ